MQPESAPPQGNFEQVRIEPKNIELPPVQVGERLDGFSRQQEQLGQDTRRPEQESPAVQTATSSHPSIVGAQPSVSSSAPTLASDEDLIEKEWVEKIKDIIKSTKDDPYEQEKQISELQADYLLKRYGRIIGEE